MDIPTLNLFLVGADVAGSVIILNPPRRPLLREEALNLAAWLVVMAGSDAGEEFRQLVEKVTES